MRGVKNGSVNDHSSDCKEIIPSTNSLRWLTAIDIALLSSSSSESSDGDNDIGNVNHYNHAAAAPPHEDIFLYPQNRGIRLQSRTPSSGEEVPRVNLDIVNLIDILIRNGPRGGVARGEVGDNDDGQLGIPNLEGGHGDVVSSGDDEGHLNPDHGAEEVGVTEAERDQSGAGERPRPSAVRDGAESRR